MGANNDAAVETPPARAGTARVITTMGVVALVAVTLVVVSARLGSGNPDRADGVEESVPTTLAGDLPPGDVPPAVVDAFDAPVIGAAVLDAPPPDVVDGCSDSMGEMSWDDGQPVVEYAVATPDGVFSSVVGTGQPGEEWAFDGGPGQPERFRVTCSARFEDGRWITEGGGFEPIFDDEDLAGGEFGSSGYSCCDSNGLATATGSVEVPDGAAWAVQDRNGWYLAYPTRDTNRLMLTWKFRETPFGDGSPPQSSVTFLDADGVIVGEAFAGGRF